MNTFNQTYKDLNDEITKLQERKQEIVESVKKDFYNSNKYKIGDNIKGEDIHLSFKIYTIKIESFELFITSEGIIVPYAIGRKMNADGFVDSRTKTSYKVKIIGSELCK